MEEKKRKKAEINGEEKERSRSRVFCSETSLHGWKYCYDAPSLAHTLGWLLVISLSVGSVVFLVFANTMDFYNSTVAFNLESPTASLDLVYFPSVTLCNMNLLSQSFIHHVGKDETLKYLE